MRLVPVSSVLSLLSDKTITGTDITGYPSFFESEAMTYSLIEEETGFTFLNGTYTGVYPVQRYESMIPLRALPISSVTSVVLTMNSPKRAIYQSQNDYLATGINAPITLTSTQYSIEEYGIRLQYVNPGYPGKITVVYTGGYSAVSQTITNISVANPSVITVAGHGYQTGDIVTISGSDSTPVVDGEYTATRIDANTFSVPVNVTVGGTTGSVTDNVLPVSQTLKMGALRQTVYDLRKSKNIGTQVLKKQQHGERVINQDVFDPQALRLIERSSHKLKMSGMI